MHTSTVTVSVTNDTVEASSEYLQRDDDDFRIEWFSGTGKGGQHRNRHANCCRIIHLPTGIKQEQSGRKREQNKKNAIDAINKILDQYIKEESHTAISNIKKNQKGSGMRGDKIRTYRFQNDQVIDHRSGKRATAAKIMKGYFELLW